MAKPRIFISSTYYDLKNIRADLERYIKDRNYDPVLNEKGNIPYGSKKRLEEYCYKEIELCDILISIFGGRYGAKSKEEPYSISQKELKVALESGKPVYIFVENNVLSEYRTYEQNKDKKDIKYVSVDDIRIFKFIEEIMLLQINNPIAPFETSSDIIDYLQEQWSGLFQRLLQDSPRQKEVRVIDNLKTTISTLDQLVHYLTEDRKKGDQAIRDILQTNHPIFSEIKKIVNVSYRVFFTNLDELNIWLSVRGYTPVGEDEWDNPNYMEWINDKENKQYLLKIHINLFDKNNKLALITSEDWKDNYLKLDINDITSEDVPIDEDIPF